MQALLTPASREIFTDPSGKYTSSQPYNLNVVNFVPKDLQALPKSRKRLSAILLHPKSFLKEQMTKRGFPNSETGLFVNVASDVKITHITGKFGHQKYAFKEPDAHELAIAEIEAFYAKNPA